MESENLSILSVTGEHFEDFIKIAPQEEKDADLELAWQLVRNQIQSFRLNFECNLNRIFIDLMRLQLLVYPIIEDWKRPLSQSEWKQVEEEFEDLKQQKAHLHYLSLQVKKKDPAFFKEISSLFYLLFRYNQDLQSSWSNFRSAWQNYKREWEIFEEHRKTQVEVSNLETPASNSDSSLSKAQKVLFSAPKPPPQFQREHWHALRSATLILEASLHEQCDSYLPAAKQDAEETMSVNQQLSQELQQIYLRTQGFELLDKVKQVQERNDQLIEDLQRICGEEAILSEAFKQKALASETELSESQLPKATESKSKLRIFLRFLSAGIILLFVSIILFFSIRNQSPKPQKKVKHLVFKPKGKTLTLNTQKNDDLKAININDVISGFKSGMPQVRSEKRLDKLVQTNPPSPRIIHDIIREQGIQTTFLFKSANRVYLFWQGKVKEFSSLKSLKQQLTQLEQQYQAMDQVLKRMGADLLNSVRRVPENRGKQAVYALEIKNEKGQVVGQVYSEQGKYRMQWNTGKSSGMVIADTPEEIVQRLQKQAKQRREHEFRYE